MSTGLRELRLLPPALAGWLAAGIAVGATDREAVVAVAGGAWVIVAVLVGVVLRVPPRSGTVLAAALSLVAAAVVLIAVSAGMAAREPPALADAVGGGATLVALEVTTQPRGGRVRGIVDGAPVLVLGEATDPGIATSGIGDLLRVRGSIARAEPGDAVAFLVFAREPVQLERRTGGPLAIAVGMRATFAGLAARLPGPGAALLPGLAIGDTSAVDERLDDQMKVASLSHLTAVSGSNCAVVVAVVYLLAAGVGLPRLARIAAAAVALGGFVVLVTPEPSVLRASVMAAVGLLAVASSRPARGIPLLCLAVIVLLVADPWLARNYGFALSVLATAGLLVLARPLAERLARWLPRWLALVVAVPVAAQLACQPVLLMLEPSLPVYGVLANVLAEPAAPLATVAGLAGCLLGWVAPGLGMPLVALAWLPATWIATVAEVVAGLPGARSPWLPGPAGVALLAIPTVAAAVLLLGAGGRRVARVCGAVLVLALAAYPATGLSASVATALSRPSDWQLALCDVGQGDALVMRDVGHVVLVDTGPEPEPLASCLAELGIGRVDLLVLTHFDLDHVGGVDAVAGRVDRVLAGPPGAPEHTAILDALAASGARVEQAERGLTGELGGWRWRVLWPPSGGVEPGNAASIAMQWDPVACTCLSALLLGDLGEESQLRMLGALAGGIPPVDVVKVAHHGSRDQAAALYRDVRAAVGIIGVGAENRYGHPAPDLLDLLDEVGTAVARSDRDGLILLAPGEGAGEVRVWRERGG